MKKTAYRKDVIRAITRGKKRFCSIIIIVALGVVTYSGLRAACVDLRRSADRFYDEQNLYDIMIQSTLGLTDDDVEALAALEGIEAAEGGYSETVYLSGDSHEEVLIKTISPTGMSEPYVVEGELPQEADEIAVTTGYITSTGKGLGDTVTIEEIEDDEEEDEEETEADEEEAETSSDEADEDDISIEVDIDTSSLEEEDEPTFPNTEFTITAIVIDPADINNPDSSTTFRITSTTDYTFFVTEEAFNSDVYTAVYLTVSDVMSLNCYSETYEDAVSDAVDLIEEQVKAERETARTEEVIQEAQEKIDDAQATMDEAFADVDSQIADAEAELADAREELDDGWASYYDGLEEVADGWDELEDGIATLEEEEANALEEIAEAWAEIEDGRAEIEDAWAEIEENEALLEEGQAELDEAKAELIEAQLEAEEQIAAGKAELEAAQAELEETLAELEAQVETAKAQLPVWPEAFDTLRSQTAAGEDTTEAEAALEEALAQMYLSDEMIEGFVQLAVGLGQVDAGLMEIEAQWEALYEQEAEAEAEFEAAWATIDESQAEIDEGLAEIEEAKAQLEEAEAELDEGEAELTSQEQTAKDEFADAWATIEESRQELEDAEKELADALEELNDGEEEYADGLAQLEEGIETYESERADAEAELADAQAEVDDIDDAVWYVQDRSSLSGYANIDSDSSAIEAIGNAFPIIFLAVAILISLTTITRMVEEERSLIGTYKAIGMTGGEILGRYMIFSLLACLAGSLVGLAGGFIALPEIVFIIFNTMYSLPGFYLSFDPLYGLTGPAIFIVGVVLATWLACRAAMKEHPAVLMRPKTPKSGSKVFLERITPLWKRLSFLNKVTARNLFRYKKRLFMTVAGILGCTALLVCGFAIKDTVTELMPKQYEQVYQYDVLVSASDNEDMLEAINASDEIQSFLNIRIDNVTVAYEDGDMSMQVIVVPDEDAEILSTYITLENTDGEACLPDETGILVTRNVEQMLGCTAGDTVSVQDLTLTKADMTVSAVVKNYLGNCVYMTQSVYETWFGEYEANGALLILDETVEDPISWADQLALSDGISSATATEQLKSEFSQAFVLINMVVYIIIILAAALALVVLFTLSTTNISEREREIATIKVLGFYRHEVHLYVNKETLILTVLGILPGLVVGTALGHAMTWVLKMPSLYFDVSIYPVSYIYSIGLTILFALLVQVITNRILDHVDPVEALKSIE